MNGNEFSNDVHLVWTLQLFRLCCGLYKILFILSYTTVWQSVINFQQNCKKYMYHCFAKIHLYAQDCRRIRCNRCHSSLWPSRIQTQLGNLSSTLLCPASSSRVTASLMHESDPTDQPHCYQRPLLHISKHKWTWKGGELTHHSIPTALHCVN